MHGYRYPAHERRTAQLAREIGFTQVSVSHEVSPLMKLVGRGDTTVVDAYLSPILRRYVEQVAGELPGVRLFFMQSNGGLTDARRFQGKDAILSGPAGGIVGMVRTAAAAGFDRDHRLRHGRHLDRRLALRRRVRARVRDPGRRRAHARADDEHPHRRRRRRLDPALRRRALSRRARTRPAPIPGPACYRRGGPLAVTDANVMLGKIQPAYFPQVFGADGERAARRRRGARASSPRSRRRIKRRPQLPSRSPKASSQIAVGNMANAIKQISVQRGHDVTRYTLHCFGGAGGQHACLVADALA